MWQEVRNQAAVACFEYAQEAGLIPGQDSSEANQKIKTWVPDTLKAQLAAYVLQWHRALPLRGIIIGQSPTPYDKGSPSSTETAPHLAASFAFREGVEPPAASEILANEFRLCGKDGAEALEAVRDCWKLVEQGVVSVHALPLGMENRFDWSPATESDTAQMQALARALCHLVSLSAEMGPRGSTRVVAMGRWAHDVASELRRQFTERLQAGQSKFWTLDIRASLSHPARTWHKFQTRAPEQITMGREEDLLALYDLFLSGKHQHQRPHLNGNGAGNGNGNGHGHPPVPSLPDRCSTPAPEPRMRYFGGLGGAGNNTGFKACSENGGIGSVRSSFGGSLADGCNIIGYGGGLLKPPEDAQNVLKELQFDSNISSLGLNGSTGANSVWPERGIKTRVERALPVFRG